MSPRLGVVEIIISCLIGLIGIGLPVTMLVFLYMIYNKIKSLEELLKKE
jgi:uncharacterized membrane protein